MLTHNHCYHGLQKKISFWEKNLKYSLYSKRSVQVAYFQRPARRLNSLFVASWTSRRRDAGDRRSSTDSAEMTSWAFGAPTTSRARLTTTKTTIWPRLVAASEPGSCGRCRARILACTEECISFFRAARMEPRLCYPSACCCYSCCCCYPRLEWRHIILEWKNYNKQK